MYEEMARLSDNEVRGKIKVMDDLSITLKDKIIQGAKEIDN